jgi:hypothetical protein
MRPELTCVLCQRPRRSAPLAKRRNLRPRPEVSLNGPFSRFNLLSNVVLLELRRHGMGATRKNAYCGAAEMSSLAVTVPSRPLMSCATVCQYQGLLNRSVVPRIL